MIHFINHDYNYDDKLSVSVHIMIICHDFFITLTFSFRDYDCDYLLIIFLDYSNDYRLYILFMLFFFWTYILSMIIVRLTTKTID